MLAQGGGSPGGPPELLAQHLEYVKTGLPGMAYVRLDNQHSWPEDLTVRLPQ